MCTAMSLHQWRDMMAFIGSVMSLNAPYSKQNSMSETIIDLLKYLRQQCRKFGCGFVEYILYYLICTTSSTTTKF